MGQIKSLHNQVNLLGIIIRCKYSAVCAFYHPDGRLDSSEQVHYGDFNWRIGDDSGAGDRRGSVFCQTGGDGTARS
ncbi:hypothetical protein D3C79_1046820 [compost metagenome]